MKTYQTEQIRNIALLGNTGSGKTSLAESMMFEGKIIERKGTIDGKNTVSDYTEIEQQNQRSIFSTLLYTEFNNSKLNIIDTPGSDDFVGAVISSMYPTDLLVMVINAQYGVEVGTEIFNRHAEHLHKPMILAVNQLDHDKANFDATLDSLKQTFGNKVILTQYPVATGAAFDSFIDVITMKMYKFKGDTGIREEFPIPDSEMDKATELHNALIEAAAENDESLMEKFFEQGSLSEDEMRSGLSKGIASRSIMPVFCLSAAKNIGTKRLMDFIINVGPNPTHSPVLKNNNNKPITCDASAPTSLFIFKSTVEPHIGEISYFRVMSGKVTEGMDLTNANNSTKERLSQLFVVAGKNRNKVTELVAGDIGATVKLKNSKTNHTLCGPGLDFTFDPMEFPDPKFRTAVKPKNEAEVEKLGELLNRAHQEDPTILVEHSKELRQIILSGQGEFHLNILKWQLTNLHKLEIEYIAPRIPYRETITKVAQADYRHKKQSGGAGQFGEVHLVIEPYVEGAPDPVKYKVNGKEINLSVRGKEVIDLEWGGKLVFYNCIVGGAIDARFMPAILKGIMEKMEQGPLTGSYARDIRVAVYDGKMHPVDSNEISFKLAGRNAFKNAFKDAGPKIMEPIYDVEVLVPADRMGDVMSDLQNRRAIIMGMGSVKGFEVINAKVPLAELNRYSTALSSLTSGRATYTMKFASYEQVPADVQEKLLKAYQEQEEEE
ncbi:elongation factor G [Tenuifilum sp.]|uniref:elongation factor G n=2 Tax=Tenuifilum sp. TaxID=2760880 RepID=UPI001B6EAFDB|nr:elongation factor G [Bacteroidales bacterium]HOK85689.1 elongation factor G [Tenuifilum sp.]MBP9028738.1 elongation factor G [Bacteroidales bacterium]HON70407.1 elongation factor G [Tenuifilum sp.]HOU73326.1 elongation factor G [Tenuifilum sp.]